MTTAGIAINILLIGGSFAAFAVLHSLTAGRKTRDYLACLLSRRVVYGMYRLTYNVVSVLTLALPLALIYILHDVRLYQAVAPLNLILLGIQLIGFVGVTIALLQTGIASFSGLRQFLTLFSGHDPAVERAHLQTGGLYQWMRHPLYVFSLLVIWSVPLMTLNILIFNIAATLYFVLGSMVEEQRLERLFGEEYRQYKEQVGWLTIK
jgi:methanethiol S-methyltransferase